MINFPWNSRKNAERSYTIDDEVLMRIKEYQQKNALKIRTINAIKYTTNWQTRLINFLEKNKNNQKLILDVVEYRNYLLGYGMDEELVCKECLEKFMN